LKGGLWREKKERRKPAPGQTLNILMKEEAQWMINNSLTAERTVSMIGWREEY